MHMKTTSQFVLAGVLALLAGTVAPAYAHQGQHQSEGKPPKQEHQAKPEKQHQDKDKQQKDQNKKPPHVQQPHQQQATQQGRRVPSCTIGRNSASASTGCPWWWWADIPASSTVAFVSV